jgi:hypothetical protein
LWYETSNSYNIVDAKFKLHLDHYFKASSLSEFENVLAESGITNPKPIIESIKSYLETCNVSSTTLDLDTTEKTDNKCNLTSHYTYNNQSFTINYDSELVKKVLHPPIAHLETAVKKPTRTVFDIYLDDDLLFLFKNDTLLIKVPKADYHKTQGKFMMHLFCHVHHKKEDDWIGMFHGSTVSDGSTSIMFIGESGKGKSTLTAILASKRFELVSDDISPLAAQSKTIYVNPAAVSVKKGSFNVLKPFVPNIETVETVELNKSKGKLKYIPFQNPKSTNYPCTAIVLVNYKKNAETELKEVSITEILKTLIPDSWISPDSEHAKQFLDWLQTLHLYQITYSNTDSVTAEIASLFETTRDNKKLT